MKAAIPWLGAVLGAGLVVSLAQAQYYAPALHYPILPAPDACGPGFYCYGPCGAGYGPSYYLRPPFPPVNGVPPPAVCPKGCEPPMTGFPSHAYIRGPRDYFMFTEVLREKITLERRPLMVP